MNVYLDIETYPDVRDGALQRYIDGVQPPGNYKKPETIAEWKAANAVTIGTDLWERSALDPMAGSIGVICWAVEGGESRSLQRAPESNTEDLLLMEWAEQLHLALTIGPGEFRLPRFIGWNIAEFDLRFIAIRCAIHGIAVPFRLPVNERYDGRGVCDLMRIWSGYRGFQKQSTVAKAMGIPLLDETDGADLWRLVKAHGVEAALSKCRSDMVALDQIYRRMQPVFGC